MSQFKLSYKIVETVDLSIEKIKNPKFIDRKNFDEKKMESLVSSIKNAGLLNPIWVRKTSNGYVRIAGSRRVEAHKILKKDTIRSVIFKVSDEAAYRLSRLENIERENIAPIDELYSILNLIKIRRLARLKSIGEETDIDEPLLTLGSNLYRAYVIRMRDSQFNSIEESPELKELLDSMEYICGQENLSINTFVKRLSLLDLPRRLLVEVNNGHVSINAAFAAVTWRKKILGSKDKGGAYNPERIKKYEKLVKFIVEERPPVEKVVTFAKELVAAEVVKSGVVTQYNQYLDTLKAIKFVELSNQNKVKILALLKKIDKITQQQKK